MNPQDVILTALKAGTPLNPDDKIYRSIGHLALLAGVAVPQVEELLLGDLAALVAVKPSQKHGWMVRLRSEENKAAAEALKALVEAAAEMSVDVLNARVNTLMATDDEVVDAEFDEQDGTHAVEDKPF